MPARYKRVIKALRKLGIEIARRPGKGSHAVLADRQGRSYTIPLHHGEKTELSDTYLRGLCRAFEVDFDELRRLL